MLSQTEIFLAKIEHTGRKKWASFVSDFKSDINTVFEERKLVYPCLFLKMIVFSDHKPVVLNKFVKALKLGFTVFRK